MASWNGIFHQYARGSRAIGLGVILALAGVGIVASGGCTLDVAGASAGGSTSTASTGSTSASTVASTSSGSASAGTGGGCAQSSECDDQNACTDDVCMTGTCTHPANDAAMPSDGLQCTDDVCKGGVESHPVKAAGELCAVGGTLACDGVSTSCPPCTVDTDCAGKNATCDKAQHICISCSDNLMNGGETGIDCGGKCGKCIGIGCANPAECANGQCVDKVCCDTTCTGVCQACNVAGSPGVCTSVAVGDPDPMTCGGPMMGCDGANTCKGLAGKACTLALAGECLSNTCLAGFCRAPVGTMCNDDFVCASQRCAGGVCAACTVNTDCPTSMLCVGSTCKAPGGAPCNMNADCANDSCQLGLCLLDNTSACKVNADCRSGFCDPSMNNVCAACAGNGNCSGNATCGNTAFGNNTCEIPSGGYCATTMQCAGGGTAKCQGFPSKCK